MLCARIVIICVQYNMYTYKIHLRHEPEGGFTVTVPVLPGCITYGDDVEQAIEMAKEAIELYIEELRDRGESVPDLFLLHNLTE